ncbi:hypothetical protein [Flavihumibacter solisilvae]|uniref:Uncharacterized protein n=1 Tax=Flavihumibacter solisilvae TaxID=1349421 RepID=A0A0C1IJL2_9BACT|nr:hypothetical protein [Flavihumibacter solisilvae]KIC94375.1 hypothetical protein OI18_12200 [Flavihumibacter solisilvae]
MATITKKKKKTSFYLVIGITGIFAVLGGFFTTYLSPMTGAQFHLPAVIHIHGAFAFAWILLFLAQSVVIKSRNFPLHKTLGYCGIFIALGTALTMLPAGFFAVEKGLAKGEGQTAISSLPGVFTSAIMFIALVGAGYWYRKNPRYHKRIMLLATIVLLWPAWFRFRHYFPSVPRPDIWFAVVLADSLIIIAWIADGLTYGKVHPVLLYTGLFIIGEHALEVALFDSEPWRVLANCLYGISGG